MKMIRSAKGKTTMPELPEYFIVSDRLRELAISIQRKKAVLIAAPSGYGKTTFMIYTMTRAPEETDRICWNRFDNSDNELSVFYSNLTEALFPEEDVRWADVRAAIAEYTEPSSQYGLINAVICGELWNAYGKQRDKRVYIAFDNFHNVADTPEIAESVAYLIDNLPRNISLFITSREQPRLLGSRFLLDAGCVAVGGKELCFIESDIGQLAESMYMVKPDDGTARRIFDKTEGWKAGTILLLQYHDVAGIAETDRLLGISLRDTALYEYLLSEVLGNLDPELMRFLMKIAILRDFTEDAAMIILGNDHSGQIIRECERRGLFIDRTLGDTVVFSFHNLFRETLLLLQKSRVEEEELCGLHLKAAAYYQNLRMYRKAAEHFVASGDINSAVVLIVSNRVDFMVMEAVAEMRELLLMIPDEIIEAHGHLLYIKCGVYMQDKSKKPEQLLTKALAKFTEAGDLPMQLNTLLVLANLAMLATFSNMAAYYAMKCLKVLRKLEPGEELTSMRRLCLFMAAVCMERFERAKRLAGYLQESAMPDGWRWQFLMLMCDFNSATGDFGAAEANVRAALAENLSRKVISYRGTALTLLSRILCFRDDWGASASVNSDLKTYGQKFGFHFFRAVAERSDAYFLYASNDVTGALDGMRVAERYFELQDNPALALLARMCTLLWQPVADDREARYVEAKRILERYERLQPGFCLKEACRSLFGAIARECGYPEAAESALQEAVSRSGAAGGRHVLCGTLFHIARLYIDRQDYVRADAVLERAMAIASDSRYVIFWDIHHGTMVNVLLYCVKKWLCAQYAMELLDRYFGDGTAASAVRELRNVNLDGIASAANRVLSGLSTPERDVKINVRLMGEFSLTCNGEVVPAAVWKTRKVKGILQYLAYRQGTRVSREQLMELFWPSADRDDAAESLNTALYQLRKVLKSYGKAVGASGCIKSQSGGLLLNSGADLVVDTTEMIQLWNIYNKRTKSDRGDTADKELLLKVVRLHTGIFLADDPCCEWAIPAREQLDAICLEAVKALCPLLLGEKEYLELEPLLQKALDIDPYSEYLAAILIRIFRITGNKTRALRFYTEFSNRLKAELGVLPGVKLQKEIEMISGRAL